MYKSRADAPAPAPAGVPRRCCGGLVDAAVLWFPLWLISQTYQHAAQYTAVANATLWYYPVGALFLVLGYFLLCFWAAGRTVGMAVCGLALASSDGRPITFRQATVRVLVSWLSALVFGVGFLWAVFHPRRQTWHDYAADTIVVRARRQPRPAPRSSRTVTRR
jgi:uncharacterized RDD family membrane protein YckC